MSKPSSLFILLILIASSVSVFGQSIKSATYRVISDINNPILKIEEFDKNGLLIRKTECQDSICKKRDVDVFIYDYRGYKVLDSTFTNKWGYHQLISKWAYSYYDDGKLSTKRNIEDVDLDSLQEIFIYGYDSLGRLLRVEHHPNGRNIKSFTPIKYTYDSLGHLVAKTAMHQHDTTKVFYENIYSYDKHGNTLEDRYFTDNRGVWGYSSSTEYDYDKETRMTQKRWLCCETTVDSVNYVYDEKGRIKSEESFPGYADDIWKQWFENIYDEKTGMLIAQNHFLNFEGKIIPKQSQLVEYEFWK